MIEFLKETHVYLKDGIIVQSVTQILQRLFPNKYKDVDSDVLSKKAKFGTKGHEVIEHLDVCDVEKAKSEVLKLYETKQIDQDLFICLREYLRLVKEYEIVPFAHEQIISYEYQFCGTLDMKAYVKKKKALIDIKFTAELDEEYLSWQLGMYNLADNEEYEEYYCLWLPKKGLGQLKKITIKTKEEILKMLNELEEI